MLKKLCFEMRTVTKSNPERDFFSFMSKRRKYAICQFLLRTRAFYAWHVHDSPYSSFQRKKIEPILFYEGMNANVFRRSIAFVVVVMPHSGSFEYTISVHAGVERNVIYCSIYQDTPKLPPIHLKRCSLSTN